MSCIEMIENNGGRKDASVGAGCSTLERCMTPIILRLGTKKVTWKGFVDEGEEMKTTLAVSFAAERKEAPPEWLLADSDEKGEKFAQGPGSEGWGLDELYGKEVRIKEEGEEKRQK